MTEEIFRSRKSPQQEQTQGQESMDQIASVRRAVATETNTETTDPIVTQAPFNVEGNVPNAMKEALYRNQSQSKQPRITNASQSSRVAGSNKLEDLIDKIGATTNFYHEITLPSTGKFYDGVDGPTDGKLHLRPMTGEEEQILATPRLVRTGQAINLIFDRCIKEDFKSDQFLTPDRTFLLIFLRGLSYTKNYDVEVKCPECTTKFPTMIDLDLYVNKCPTDFNKDSLSGNLPTTGFSFRYRISRGYDEQGIQEHRERRIKGGFDLSGQADDTLLYRTCSLLEEIEGLTDKDELFLLLKRLPINDVAFLRNAVNNPPFGAETNINISCPVCFAEFSIDMPLEANFFFPRTRKEGQNSQV